MECQYCKKNLNSKSALNLHQKNTKYCLKIQGNLCKGEYVCECGKNFHNKHHLISHQDICQIINTLYVQELRKRTIIIEQENYILKSKLADALCKEQELREDALCKEQELREDALRREKELKEDALRREQELREDYAKLALKAISRPTQQITQNNKHVINLAPFDLTQEKAKQIFNDNYTTDHFLQGMKGLVNFVSDHIIKTDTGESIYACYDRSRNVFKYKNEAGEYINDIKAMRLVEIIHPAAKETGLIMNVKFHDEYMEALSEYDGDKSNNTVTLDELERKELRTQQACASFLLHQYLNTELDSFSSELGDKIKK